MTTPAAKSRHRPSPLTRECDLCGQSFNVRGLAGHQKACRVAEKQRESDQKYEKKLRREAKLQRHLSSIKLRDEWDGDNGQDVAVDDSISGPGDHPQLEANLVTSAETTAHEDRVGDIKTEYHPHSGLPTRIESLHEYKQRSRVTRERPSSKPWKPFRTRGDFEFAEMALEAALNKAQTDPFIKFIHHCVNKPTSFTLHNHAELTQMWEQAANKLTPF